MVSALVIEGTMSGVVTLVTKLATRKGSTKKGKGREEKERNKSKNDLEH